MWQVLHSAVVAMWLEGLPPALVPLWQLEQVPITSAWFTVLAGDHAVVVWQSAQALVVLMWLVLLPVALVPLWQDEQAAVVVL